MNIYIQYGANCSRKSVWLSCEYLKSYGISVNSIKNWNKRNIGKYKYFNNRICINYETIPEPTRNKLPDKFTLMAEEKDEKKNELQQYFFRELEKAYNGKEAAKWRNEILKLSGSERLSNEKLLEFSRKAAVFEKILSIYHGKKGDLDPLFNAYSQIFPNFSMRNRFCMAIKDAKTKGILSVAVKGTCLNTGRPEVYTDEHKYYAARALSHNKAYSITDSYTFFSGACTKVNIPVPKFEWFYRFYKAIL